MRADNTAHLLTAARERAQRTRQRALTTLRRLDATGAAITVEALAREAGVSRSWIYGQPDLRAEVQRLRQRPQPMAPVPATPDRQRASADSLLRRLQAATERLRRLEQDNQQLRDALAEALGTNRDARIRKPTTNRDTPE
jgi:small-conductance mechanosensitive channel